MLTVYISVGNSDDRLSQQEWFAYLQEADEAIARLAARQHGLWYSGPRSPFQNACWCIELPYESAGALKELLREVRRKFRQDSIAWAIASTEFI